MATNNHENKKPGESKKATKPGDPQKLPNSGPKEEAPKEKDTTKGETNETKATCGECCGKDCGEKEEIPEMKGMPVGEFMHKMMQDFAEATGARVIMIGGSAGRCKDADTCEHADECPAAQPQDDDDDPCEDCECNEKVMNALRDLSGQIAELTSLIKKQSQTHSQETTIPFPQEGVLECSSAPLKVALRKKDKKWLKKQFEKIPDAVAEEVLWKLWNILDDHFDKDPIDP